MGKRPEKDAESIHQFASYLRKARRNRGLSQQTLSEITQIQRPDITRFELAKRWPTFPQLLRIAKALQIPLQWFLTGAERPGNELEDIAIQLKRLGVVDLFVPQEQVPCVFRSNEEVLVLAVRGANPDPRVIEAIPAILAWHKWNNRLLKAYIFDYPETEARIGWLADVVLSIHRHRRFPGGISQEKSLQKIAMQFRPANVADSLGKPLPSEAQHTPIWKRWNITYAGTLDDFFARARRIHEELVKNGTPIGPLQEGN